MNGFHLFQNRIEGQTANRGKDIHFFSTKPQIVDTFEEEMFTPDLPWLHFEINLQDNKSLTQMFIEDSMNLVGYAFEDAPEDFQD